MIGVLLAGGAGRRLGGVKPARELAGRPLAQYPAEALSMVCERVAIVAKPDSDLPRLDGVERWSEPAEPLHPLTGIVAALERAGEPILVCAADMPFVTPAALNELIVRAKPPATVSISGGWLQPVLAVYAPDALPKLKAAEPGAPLTRTVESLNPTTIELPDEITRSIDTPEQLKEAERHIGFPP